MKGLKLLGNEFLAICRNRKLLVPIIAVLMVPVLYSGMFLGAFWDPYERLDQLPVAVVNMDEGATLDSKDLHIGDELVEKLKEEEEGFKWDFVDLDTAQKGLEHEKYYMMIKIPKNFSQNATTLKDNTPQHLELEYIPNESYNFLSSQIGSTAILKIKEKLSKTVTETYAEEIFDKIAEAGDGIQKAADGSKDLDEGVMKLQDGSGQVTDGAVQVRDGATELKNGAIELKDGVTELKDGATQLKDGAGQVKDGLVELHSKTAQLNDGVQRKLAPGANQLAQGLAKLEKEVIEGKSESNKKIESKKAEIEELTKGINKLYAGLNTLDLSIDSLEQKISRANIPAAEKQEYIIEIKKLAGLSKGLNEGAEQVVGQDIPKQVAGALKEIEQKQVSLLEGIGKLKKGSTDLSNGLKGMASQTPQLVAGVGQLKDGSIELADGSIRLADGSTKLADGSIRLADGSTKLADGSIKVADGSTQVTDGLATAKDGTSKLSTGLAEGAEKSGEVQGDQKKYEMLASPVDVKEEKYTPVPNYGTGFAPYFLSLGLFVGALLISIVFPLRESAGTPTSGFSWFISKFGVLLFVGIAQALISVAILLFVLGIEVQSVPLFILFSIITSLAFLTLVQFLVTALGDTGRFVAIIILILQLTTSAGTFPLELIPEWLQAFNAWLPMTYSVAGLKAVISSGDFSFMWENAQLLFIFIALAMAGTVAVLTLFFKRQYGTVTKTVAKEV
ncbi:YhgE/Pip domain-containing protein [Priestia taiwanensis]|uniref:ABC-2 type transporter transmembrane domain-containing protein n=1 Tax=Priestia taiwanensis TaxID=1347902 RepID=A0A917AW72_9BACI|nr:YhgE/Pip domain-containing protein [Priestia taiwanensis]MBM7363673.1 putative membrane protein [Priestia taiwanensis]GGE75028.1 hypothetical protein GCM10007140_26130 [Priestia taiwanensis]